MTDDSERIGKKVAKAARRVDADPRLLTAARLARQLLPGDSQFGDPLSTAGGEQPHVVGRRLATLTEKRPGVLREVGLSALQVWQAVSESAGRGRGERELAIAFTDLVDFSEWALAAGDDAALDCLRDVGQVIEPEVRRRGGDVVKWLGDGMMAVFGEAPAAIEAVIAARDGVARLEAEGWQPQLRAGVHVGRPRRLGGDYLGVDVNIAARVADHAGAGEVLISDSALERLDAGAVEVRRKRRFKVKGVPKDMAAHSVVGYRPKGASSPP